MTDERPPPAGPRAVTGLVGPARRVAAEPDRESSR